MQDEIERIERVRKTVLTLLSKGRRSADFTQSAPTRWEPTKVKDFRPERFFEYFSNENCWEFIEDKLKEGCEIKEMKLDKPPGATGYVMLIEHGSGVPIIYIKLQIGKKEVIGRSFHYEDPR